MPRWWETVGRLIAQFYREREARKDKVLSRRITMMARDISHNMSMIFAATCKKDTGARGAIIMQSQR